METKKCPKCGAEIPVEMSFCLHCMERTDGALEIKRKAVPSRKYIIAAVIAFLALLAAIILLLLVPRGSGNNAAPSDVVTSATGSSTDGVHSEATTQPDESTQTQAAATSKTPENSAFKASKDTDNSSEDNTLPQSEAVISTEEDTPEEPVTAPVQPTDNATTAISFEEVFTERMNSWGAPHILADTLSFTGNGCTFTSNVGTDKVNCTVTAEMAMSEYTLTIEPFTELTRYGTSIYIPDIVNEMTYFVLGRRMDSSTRTAIADMFENFEASGHFSENGLTCDINTQAHNNGSYPITVSCKITE